MAPNNAKLRTAYDATKALSNASGTYTASTWANLQVVLSVANGVLGDTTATQPQIESALQGLAAALTGLKFSDPVVTKSVLQSVLTNAKALSNADGTYTADSWTALESALANAQSIVDNTSATQAQIDLQLRH